MSNTIIHNVAFRWVLARTPAEGRQENNGYVEADLPPELQLLWRKVKRQFKGTPNSRREQFEEWLHENPDANIRHLEELAEKARKQKEREEKKLLREEEARQRAEKAKKRQEEKDRKEKERLEKRDTMCQKMCPHCQAFPDEEAPF